MHFSTDYVFDGGLRRPYVETDAAAPLNHYGMTKWRGEQAIAPVCSRHLIFRIAWLHGRGGSNFIGKILARASESGEVRVVDDQRGSPTFADDVVEQVLTVLRTDAGGLFHSSNTGDASWYDLAREVFSLLGIRARLQACPTSDFPQKARRPAWSVLENARLKELGCHVMRPWKDALEDFLEYYRNGKEVKR